MIGPRFFVTSGPYGPIAFWLLAAGVRFAGCAVFLGSVRLAAKEILIPGSLLIQKMGGV